MMDRVEDETVRYLFFLQVRSDAPIEMPAVEEEEEAEQEAAEARGRAAAQSTIEDFTRNVQRKKDKEMAELQFVGGDSASGPKQVLAGKKVGRNEKCPCGSGKKYKHCHGA
jgi:preprotein translocase subunit SecA